MNYSKEETKNAYNEWLGNQKEIIYEPFEIAIFRIFCAVLILPLFFLLLLYDVITNKEVKK